VAGHLADVVGVLLHQALLQEMGNLKTVCICT
jgi:hypothetical protein